MSMSVAHSFVGKCKTPYFQYIYLHGMSKSYLHSVLDHGSESEVSTEIQLAFPLKRIKKKKDSKIHLSFKTSLFYHFLDTSLTKK